MIYLVSGQAPFEDIKGPTVWICRSFTCICPAHKGSDWLGCFSNHEAAIHKSDISPFWVTDKFVNVGGDSEVWKQASSSSSSSSSFSHTAWLVSAPSISLPSLSPCAEPAKQKVNYYGWVKEYDGSGLCTCVNASVRVNMSVCGYLGRWLGFKGWKLVACYGWHVSRPFTCWQCVTHTWLIKFSDSSC